MINNFFPQMNNMMQMVAQFKQNPMKMLMQKYNIPQNINDPQQIVKHLVDSGQVTQDQVNRAMQMRNNPMFKNMF